MQTSQVSNAANVLTATPAPHKQPDANTAPEPFGKVLSREVSQRNGASEPPKNKDAGAPASAHHASKTPGKPSETKSVKEGKPADKAQPDDEAVDAASALPDEMLALVANLADMATAATPAGDAQALPSGELPQGATTDVNPIALPAAAGPADAKPVAATESLAASAPASANDAPTMATAISTAALAGKSERSADQFKPAEPGQTEPQAAAMKDKAAMADELPAQAASRASSARAQDFSAALSESVSGVGNTMQPVQQTALNALQQQVSNTAERLTPRVGTPAWDQALGQKVVWMVAGEQQSASLTLNPPDLGPLQVVLNVSNSQANATFIAAQPEVRQALEAALPKLRDMLGEAGIQLGQASVNSGAPNQQGGFEQSTSQSARGAARFADSDSAGADAQMRVSRVQSSSSGMGLVDTFV